MGDRQQLQLGADHVYDLRGLVKAAGCENVSIVGHSMDGMVSLTYAGGFPEEVSRLVVLDGVTNYPARRVNPPTSESQSGSEISTNWRNGKSTAVRRSPMAPSESFIATGILRPSRRCTWRPTA